MIQCSISLQNIIYLIVVGTETSHMPSYDRKKTQNHQSRKVTKYAIQNLDPKNCM